MIDTIDYIHKLDENDSDDDYQVLIKPCCFCKVFHNKCNNCKLRVEQFMETYPNYKIACNECKEIKSIDGFLITQTTPNIIHRIKCKSCWIKVNKKSQNKYCEVCQKNVTNIAKHKKTQKHLISLSTSY